MNLSAARELVSLVCLGLGAIGAGLGFFYAILFWRGVAVPRKTVLRKARVVGFVQGERGVYPVVDLGEDGAYRPTPVPTRWKGEPDALQTVTVRLRPDDLGSVRLERSETARKISSVLQMVAGFAIADICILYILKALIFD